MLWLVFSPVSLGQMILSETGPLCGPAPNVRLPPLADIQKVRLSAGRHATCHTVTSPAHQSNGTRPTVMSAVLPGVGWGRPVSQDRATSYDCLKFALKRSSSAVDRAGSRAI